MEKDRSTKYIAIIALLVVALTLTIGFSAFSNTLTIKPSAEVKTRGDLFNIDFSSSTEAFEAQPVKGIAELTTEGAELPADQMPTATDAQIDNSGDPIITNLHAVFTAPGQKVTYKFAAANVGQIDGFLRKIEFKNVNGTELTKTCTAKPAQDGENPASADKVAAACDEITISVDVGTATGITETNADFKEHLLSVGAFESIIVTIEYGTGAQPADGDFDIAFGDIVLTYESIDNNNA